jgi:Protein of unknown function (DUF3761)
MQILKAFIFLFCISCQVLGVAATSAAACPPDKYINCEGMCVPRPNSDTNDVTALCQDGTDSHSRHRTGTCSGHGGVKEWKAPPHGEPCKR